MLSPPYGHVRVAYVGGPGPDFNTRTSIKSVYYVSSGIDDSRCHAIGFGYTYLRQGGIYPFHRSLLTVLGRRKDRIKRSYHHNSDTGQQVHLQIL